MKNAFRVALALLLLAAPAEAVDGVIEINEARVAAGGITPGDTPGYPVLLSQPGSYRLTGNLVASGATDALQISANDVELDLNGFAVSNGGGVSYGIVALPGTSNPAVRNGTVRDFLSVGVALQTAFAPVILDVVVVGNGDGLRCGDCVVRGVRALSNNLSGIACESDCEVRESAALGNASEGILLSAGGVVDGCVSTGNGLNGIRAIAGATVTGSTSSGNGLAGIDAGPGCLVRGNSVHGNGTGAGPFRSGIIAASGCAVLENSVRGNALQGLSAADATVGYTGNVFTDNNTGDAAQQVGGLATDLGQNICGNHACP